MTWIALKTNYTHAFFKCDALEIALYNSLFLLEVLLHISISSVPL